jgi:hypothetical protein
VPTAGERNRATSRRGCWRPARVRSGPVCSAHVRDLAQTLRYPPLPHSASGLNHSEYNVHMIGVNWPHDVFVDQNFKVVGAE